MFSALTLGANNLLLLRERRAKLVNSVLLSVKFCLLEGSVLGSKVLGEKSVCLVNDKYMVKNRADMCHS